jgi:ubiquinone/menaquinone biosynthesis C-methylase UbiE
VTPIIKGEADLRRAYQNANVAREYIDRRFNSPLGLLLHRRQVSVLTRLIRQHSISSAIELAPGPARISADIAPHLSDLVLVDASAEMLAEARTRLQARGLSHVQFVRADAFRLPIAARSRLVYSFRLIRHFTREDRMRLYGQAAQLLVPGGWLVFDAVNEAVSAPLRRESPDEYQHYDALLTPATLAEELTASGFTIESLTGVQRRYRQLVRVQVYLGPRLPSLARAAMAIMDRSGGKPLEWIVTCRRG